MTGKDVAKIIMNLFFEDQGGDFTSESQKDDYMRLAVPACETLIKENFPFENEEYMFGLIVSPTYVIENGEEVLEFDGDTSAFSALGEISLAIGNLF